jgi:hypothetical protein
VASLPEAGDQGERHDRSAADENQRAVSVGEATRLALVNIRKF